MGGELSFSITCTDRLTISGTMTGTEGGDTDFSATLDGEYNEFTNQLDVTISNGTIELASVYNVDFDGNINGSLLPPSPDYVMEGAWDIEAPPTSGGINISGDGAGTWTAQLQ
ncbi:MAG TPA: hypothetical protein DIU15_12715 [Deltaproteobacteria bacterium]|nr:hypothetical protein [Deltaproteobacteria bacterium]